LYRALTLLNGDALSCNSGPRRCWRRCRRSTRASCTLGDMGTSDRVCRLYRRCRCWIGEKLHRRRQRICALHGWLGYGKIIRAARDTESYKLERKPLVFSVFGMLAEATR
jgi:DNA polymerase-3 subunit delta'